MGTRYSSTSSGAGISQIQTDTGNGSEASGSEISIVGGEGIDVTNAGSTITVAGEAASDTNQGIIEIATEVEIETGTDTTRAVVPGNLIPADLTWTGRHDFERPAYIVRAGQQGGWSANSSTTTVGEWGVVVMTEDDNTSSVGVTSAGRYFEQVSLSGAANNAMINSNQCTRIEMLPLLLVKFNPQKVTSSRLFIGLAANGGVFDADDPGMAHIGLQFSTARADTNWQVSRATTTTQVLTNTGIAPSTAVIYVLEIVADTTASIRIRLYDSSVRGTLLYSQTVSTGIPTSTTDLIVTAGAQSLAAATTTFRQYFGELLNTAT